MKITPPASQISDRLRAVAPYAIVLFIAGGLFWLAMHFEYTPHAGRLGPDVWPKAILVLMIAVCVTRIVGALRRPRSEGPGGGLLREVIGDAVPDPETIGAPGERYPGLLALGVALTVAYVFLLGWLGFALATAGYIAAMIRTGRYRRWRVIVPTAVLGSLGFMFVFMKIVYLSLPIGQPPFAAVSLGLMRLMAIR